MSNAAATLPPVDLDASPLVLAVRHNLPSLIRALGYHPVAVAKSYSPKTGYVTLSFGGEGLAKLLAWRRAKEHLISCGFYVRNATDSRLELTGYYGRAV